MCARGQNEHSQTDGEYDDPILSAEHAASQRLKALIVTLKRHPRKPATDAKRAA